MGFGGRFVGRRGLRRRAARNPSYKEGRVWGHVSPDKAQHPCRSFAAPTPEIPQKTDGLLFFALPLIRMGFRGSRFQISPSRCAPGCWGCSSAEGVDLR